MAHLHDAMTPWSGHSLQNGNLAILVILMIFSVQDVDHRQGLYFLQLLPIRMHMHGC